MIVTHEPDAAAIADRVAQLVDGRLVAGTSTRAGSLTRQGEAVPWRRGA